MDNKVLLNKEGKILASNGKILMAKKESSSGGSGSGTNVVVWNNLATYYISYILSSDNSEIYTTNLTDEDISTLSMLDLSKNPIINGTEIIDMTGVQMVVSASLVLSGMQIGELGNPNSNLLTGVCTINNNNIYVTIDLVGKTITYKTLPATKGTTTLVAECTLGTLISDNKYNFSCADYILNDFKNYDYIVMIINLDIGTIKLSSSVITGSTNDSIVVGRDELSAEIELLTETTGSITLHNIPSEYVSSFTIKAYKFD